MLLQTKILPSLQRMLANTMKKSVVRQFKCRRFCSFNVNAYNNLQKSEIPREPVGQPTCFTHPHLIEDGKLTPHVSQQEFKERRNTFISKLTKEFPNMDAAQIAVIPAATKQYMSGKIPYVFRQDSDFYYLTGCLEPGAVLILVKPKGQSQNYKSILFVNEKDAREELWEGTRTGCTLATNLFAVDEARPVNSIEEYLNSLVSKSKSSLLWYASENPTNTNLHNYLKRLMSLKETALSYADPQKILHNMRSIKSPAEIELMVETCRIGCEAMNMAMLTTRPGVTEQALNAVLEYTWRIEGAEHGAFPPVMAGGERAATIHYIANNQVLKDEDLVLCDSGSQYWLYNSDISRTWPVSGKFSPHQRILYELVLTTQKRLIEFLEEYRPPLDKLFENMCRLLGKYLQEEGIISKDVTGNELLSRAYNLCPHHVSHYLGLDVHDGPLITRSIPVQTGMVVTVEPGIYIRSDDQSVPKEFRGIGIRIEDDVLLKNDGVLILTSAAAKEVEHIENIVGKQHA